MARKTISATLDQRVLEQLDATAKRQKISRSRLLELCISSWLTQKTNARLKEGYLAQGALLEEVSNRAWETQREVLDSEAW